MSRCRIPCNMHKPRSMFLADVRANLPLCKDHFRLILALPRFPATAPGQFVQISCRDQAVDYSAVREFDWQPGQVLPSPTPELAGPVSLLRKPFSIAARRDVASGVEIDIIHRKVGTGTTWMSALRPGDQISIIGPLGNYLPIPGEGQSAILVGGGVGIPPMIYFASTLEGRPAVAFAGTLNRDLLPLTITADAPAPSHDSIDPLYNIAEFAVHNVPAVICTDDGSWGFRGLVTQALERYLDKYMASAPEKVVIYTCGPEGMMRRVAAIAEKRSILCYVSVERAMACGMGTCQSCVIKVKNDLAALPERDWVYKLACTDGPIFDSRKLLW